MSTIAEVKRQSGESASSVLRRFQKRVQGTGALMAVRAKRYSERELSDLKKKRAALVKLAKRAEYEMLKKLGKNIETKKRR